MVAMPLFLTVFEAFVASVVVFLWIVSESIGGNLLPFLRRSGREIQKKDRGSILLIHALLYVSILIAMLFTINGIAMLPEWSFYPGIVLMVTGILFRQWAIYILGHFFTFTVSVHEDHKVIDSGPYRLVRHPSYLGLLLILLGIGLALRSWGGILELLILNGLTIGYRIHVEEKVLVSELGDDYKQYMKRTKRLIPFLI